jgi:hypothetical protein
MRLIGTAHTSTKVQRRTTLTTQNSVQRVVLSRFRFPNPSSTEVVDHAARAARNRMLDWAHLYGLTGSG